MMVYRQFKPGDVVRDRFGDTWLVQWQRGCEVHVVPHGNGWRPMLTWIHPNNLRIVGA